jgi:hypothetical protein
MPLPPVPEQIPNNIFAILTREENSGLIDGIVSEFHIPEDKISLLSAVCAHAIMRTLPLASLQDAVKEELAVADNSAKKIALAILLRILYPYWPLYPSIDKAIEALGGKVPTLKPAMQTIASAAPKVMEYPAVPTAATEDAPELLGGLEIPAPPVPKQGSVDGKPDIALERDVPWQAPPTSRLRPAGAQTGAQVRESTVAKPGDVAKLLEKNLIHADDKTN